MRLKTDGAEKATLKNKHFQNRAPVVTLPVALSATQSGICQLCEMLHNHNSSYDKKKNARHNY